MSHILYYDYDEERYVLDAPTECPKCGGKLELDVDYDTTHLICSNSDCDYMLDVTAEFKELEQLENGAEDEDD